MIDEKAFFRNCASAITATGCKSSALDILWLVNLTILDNQAAPAIDNVLQLIMELSVNLHSGS